MAGCCDLRGCDRVFGPRFAHHVANRYRKRGLDRPARRVVDGRVAAAADHARRGVILTHPPRHAVSGADPPETMEAFLRDHGLEPGHLHQGPFWHLLAAPRAADGSAR